MKESSSLRVERISTFDKFASLEQEWNRIGDNPVKTIFLKYFWLFQWWKIYGSIYELWTLTVWDEGYLVGILPLICRRTTFGVRLLTIMGTGEVTPNHLGLIADSHYQVTAAYAIAEYLEKNSSQWDILELDKTTSDCSITEILNTRLHAHGFIVDKMVSARCLYITLPESFNEYLKLRSHNFRRRLHKAKRNMDRDFPDAICKMVTSEGEMYTVMSALIRLHQIRWVAKGYPGSFSNDNFNSFHLAVAARALSDGLLRLYYITYRNEIIAVRYAYLISDTLQSYLGGFDDRWSDYSLGFLLTSNVIEQSIVQGVRMYDFLEGEESYKKDWAAQSRENLRFRFFNPGVRGRLVYGFSLAVESLVGWSIKFIPVHVRRPLWQMILRTKSRATPTS